MRGWMKAHRELVMYLIFGVLTTAVNYGTAVGVNALLAGSGVHASWPSVSIAWAVSVLFAYVTNRIWVFESKSKGARAVLREMLLFFGARLLSGVLEVVLMTLLVDKLGYNFDVMKLLCNILVILLNYSFSKLVIFKKKAADRE